MSLPPRWLLGLVALLAAFSLAGAQTPDVQEQGAWFLQRMRTPERRPPAARVTDEALLDSMGLPTDGPGLLQFLHARTLKQYRIDTTSGRRTVVAEGADRTRIALLVRRLGDELFAVRERAARELIATGPPAIPLLQKAGEHPDLEVKRLADACLAAIETSPGSALPAAVVRLLQHRPVEGGCAALLAFLPFAGDATVEEEILLALPVVGLRGGRCELSLRAALTATDPQRRSAAAFVLGQFGMNDDRVTVRRLLMDPDPRVRLRAAQGLVAGREVHAVATLVALVGDAPLNVAFAAEDVLARLAGDRTPRVDLDATPLSRRRCHDAWAAWLRTNQDRIDLARAPELIVLNPARRAREAAEQFLDAYRRADQDGMLRLAELPYYELASARVIRNRAALDQLFQEALNFRGESGMAYTVLEVTRFGDFYKPLGAEHKALLARLRRPDVFVVSFDLLTDTALANGETFSTQGYFLIRVGNGGAARIIGAAAGDEFVPQAR
jgi:HEAT repeat protein